MRQVPAFSSYLIVGGGRMARHVAHYFSLESIPFQTWSRREGREALWNKSREASHILLLISDSAIASFISEQPWLTEKSCVHFSGAISHPQLPSAHPLMTFSNELYELATYRSIPFITEKNRAPFAALLPHVGNPHFEIASEDKPLYHALCAMSGNFTVLLWEKVASDFAEKLGLPRSVLNPYLLQTTENLLRASSNGQSVLTGPLARGDQETIHKHLLALENDPFAQVYRAFTEAYRQSRLHSLKGENDEVHT